MDKTIISGKIHTHAAHFPDKTGIQFSQGPTASYGNISRIYDQIHHFLAVSGVASYHRIALLAHSSFSYALFGLPLMEDAVYVPLDGELPYRKLVFLCKLLNIDFLLVDHPSDQYIQVASELGLGIFLFALEESENGLECRLSRMDEHFCDDRDKNQRDQHKDIAIVSTTSGTTSTPKIVPVSYASKVSSIIDNKRYYELDETTTTLVLGKKHTSQFTGSINLSLFVGGTAIILERFNHNEVIRLLRNQPITSFTAPPAVLSSFAEHLTNNQISIQSDSLRFIRATGAPLAQSLKAKLEAVFDVEVIQTYGMTEVSALTSTYKAPLGHREGSVGVSIGPQLKVLDQEILVKGPTVFSGYENPEESNETYFCDGWFRTGDMGHIDDDGYVFITGRIKEMINRGGEKVSPYEVEATVMNHPDVVQAAVFPYPNRIGSEEVGAALVMEKGKSLRLRALRDFLENHIPHYKMPTLLFVLREMPVSENGKVQRKLLYQQLSTVHSELVLKKDTGHSEEVLSASQPFTETEQALHGIWQKVLEARNIGREDDFFQLGGDSLAGAAVMSLIETRFDRQIPVSVFFEKRTIKALGQYLDQMGQQDKTYRFLVPIKDSGSKPPLICVHSGDGEAVTYHGIGRHMEEDRPVYGFRFNMDADAWQHPLAFEALGEQYAEEILALNPVGPYHLLGRCYGGILALKVAINLQRKGKKISTLVMLDSPDLSRGNGEGKGLTDTIFWKKLKNSLLQLKQKPLAETGALLAKKCSSLMNLAVESVRYWIYRVSVQTGNQALLMMGGKEAALKWALQHYRQEAYEGKVYYFKAMLDSASRRNRETYWASLIKELEVFEMDVFHNDIQNDANSRVIAEKMAQLMDGYDA
ncbi:MAG: AMP-binding protein [Bacillota bacterium]|nr:AMP-binding protein [Bacillota bacterium]MDW7676591.1 AMP-binding protein [Bacillota bacterium]